MVPVSPRESPTLCQPGSRSRTQHRQLGEPPAAANKPGGSGWRSDRFKTMVLVNLTAIMERLDEQILPAVYRFIAVSFHASPSELGLLTLSRAVVQALSSPIGGLAGQWYDRVNVTAAGCFIWGAMTAAVALCTTLQQAIACCAVNGLGLALVIPSGQSLVADFYSPATRGRAFGTLYLTGALGGMLGGLYATNVAATHPLGMEGWRFAFLMVALVSLSIGGLTLAFAKDPRSPSSEACEAAPLPQAPRGIVIGDLLTILRRPTFLIIIIQGIVGNIPWSAMVFLTLYFQLMGMSDLAASLVVSLFFGALAVGGLLGGWLGDKAALSYPNHGRIAVSQLSIGLGPIFTLLIMKGMPLGGSPAIVALYITVMVTFGIVRSWSAPACHNPVFAEIVPARLRNMVYAFDRCFEGAIAALAAPLVGYLAEHGFGFKGDAARTGDPQEDTRRAVALGGALFWFMVLPWVFSTTLYFGLYFTYPMDRAAAAAEAEAEEARRTAGGLDLQRLGTSTCQAGNQSRQPELAANCQSESPKNSQTAQIDPEALQRLLSVAGPRFHRSLEDVLLLTGLSLCPSTPSAAGSSPRQ
ncbi:hypothetical protein WJX84_005582 [Apatococcus fuscideae]|uniref:Major facilitator superfamily (MFS) profile domain-containing protein n=1 Tax=Apatococcus fuscideae TaxID=2026836 RepID=A0AAW1SXI6_9CHLO